MLTFATAARISTVLLSLSVATWAQASDAGPIAATVHKPPAELNQLKASLGAWTCKGTTYESQFGPAHPTVIDVKTHTALSGFWYVTTAREKETPEYTVPDGFESSVEYDNTKKVFTAHGFFVKRGSWGLPKFIDFRETSGDTTPEKMVYTGNYELNKEKFGIRDTITLGADRETFLREIQTGGEWKKLDEAACTKVASSVPESEVPLTPEKPKAVAPTGAAGEAPLLPWYAFGCVKYNPQSIRAVPASDHCSADEQVTQVVFVCVNESMRSFRLPTTETTNCAANEQRIRMNVADLLNPEPIHKILAEAGLRRLEGPAPICYDPREDPLNIHNLPKCDVPLPYGKNSDVRGCVKYNPQSIRAVPASGRCSADEVTTAAVFVCLNESARSFKLPLAETTPCAANEQRITMNVADLLQPMSIDNILLLAKWQKLEALQKANFDLVAWKMPWFDSQKPDQLQLTLDSVVTYIANLDTINSLLDELSPLYPPGSDELRQIAEDRAAAADILQKARVLQISLVSLPHIKDLTDKLNGLAKNPQFTSPEGANLKLHLLDVDIAYCNKLIALLSSADSPEASAHVEQVGIDSASLLRKVTLQKARFESERAVVYLVNRTYALNRSLNWTTPPHMNYRQACDKSIPGPPLQDNVDRSNAMKRNIKILELIIENSNQINNALTNLLSFSPDIPEVSDYVARMRATVASWIQYAQGELNMTDYCYIDCGFWGNHETDVSCDARTSHAVCYPKHQGFGGCDAACDCEGGGVPEVIPHDEGSIAQVGEAGRILLGSTTIGANETFHIEGAATVTIEMWELLAQIPCGSWTFTGPGTFSQPVMGNVFTCVPRVGDPCSLYAVAMKGTLPVRVTATSP